MQVPTAPLCIVRILPVAALCALVACSTPSTKTPAGPDSTQAAAQVVSTFIDSAVDGDVAGGLAALDTVLEKDLSEKDRATRRCALARFRSGTPDVADSALPAAAEPVLRAYRQYWRRVLTNRSTATSAHEDLRLSLHGILAANGRRGYDPAKLDAVTDAVVPFLESMGLHAITGVTAPNNELIVWRTESLQHFPVTLPEQELTVDVVFMDAFVSRGWVSYATCGRAAAGGWTKPDRLYAVRDEYDLASENFKVSYLGHEGQHFADIARYAKLEQPELEYRAKLAELALAISPDYARQLLAGFERGTAGRAVPHSDAGYWVAKRMRSQLTPVAAPAPAELWSASRLDDIHAAARALLRESSMRMKAIGPDVEKFLPDSAAEQ